MYSPHLEYHTAEFGEKSFSPSGAKDFDGENEVNIAASLFPSHHEKYTELVRSTLNWLYFNSWKFVTEPDSTKQRVKIIEFFYSCQRSIVMTQRKYRQYFNSRSASTAFMIRSLVCRFDELGSVLYRPGRGDHRNIRTEDNVETVRQSVADDPSVSTRHLSSQLDISRTTLRTILKLDLKMYPDKIQIVQILLPQDLLLLIPQLTRTRSYAIFKSLQFAFCLRKKYWGKIGDTGNAIEEVVKPPRQINSEMDCEKKNRWKRRNRWKNRWIPTIRS
ncbi:putative transposase [Trichonephila clavipes]|uniref:Putative transposase n=1 Tax=Trichonephila clavipes TaxID=2585209 RepID=A0A8X6W639_TRICX|nr:putative transposase [Trichonephila clavipes]